MRLISQVIIVFFTHTILEIIIMALLAKAGVPYMDFDSTGEGVTELAITIGYYYSFSKIIVIVLPYIALILIGHKIFNKASVVQLSFFISILLTIVFWLVFNNPIREILNPVLGSLFAGLFILFAIKVSNTIKEK